MNKKSKQTLKNAFNIPEPTRKDCFFDTLTEKHKKNNPFPFLRAYFPALITAAIIIGIWGEIKNLPHFEPTENIETEFSESYTSAPETTDTISTVTTYSSISENSVSPVPTTTATTQTSISVQTTLSDKQTETETTEKNFSTITTVLSEYKFYPAEDTDTRDTTRKTVTHKTTTICTTTTNIKTTAVTTVPTSTTKKTTTATTINPVTNEQATTTNLSTTYKEDDATVAVTTLSLAEGDLPHVPVTTTVCNTPEYNDFTIIPFVTYSLTENIIDIDDLNNNDCEDNPPSDVVIDNEIELWKELSLSSDLIVIATVDDVIYTGIDGKPFTQENVTINRVIYGDIPENSKISVYVEGGYIPAKYYSNYNFDGYLEYFIDNDYTILDMMGSAVLSEKGDTYIYFIRKNTAGFPKGSYILSKYTDISKYKPTEDFFTNVNKKSSTFYLEELIDFLK